MEIQKETLKDVTKLLRRALKRLCVASMLTGGGVLVLWRLPSPPIALHYVRCSEQFPQQWLSKSNKNILSKNTVEAIEAKRRLKRSF